MTHPTTPQPDPTQQEKAFLNVGGNDKRIKVPDYYQEWRHDMLDIDPDANPDILCDARELQTLPGDNYDAVYCNHNLEHYYRHDVQKVLRGFHHVLNAQGFVEIAVPDMHEVMRVTLEKQLDIDDILYVSGQGPIAVSDVIYGWAKEIEESGNEFFAHKTGFTAKSLQKVVSACGFPIMACRTETFEVRLWGFKKQPTLKQIDMLGLSRP